MKTTNIFDLLGDEPAEPVEPSEPAEPAEPSTESEPLIVDNVLDKLLDTSADMDERLALLDSFSEDNELNTFDLFNRLSNVYMITPMRSIGKYLLNIIQKTKLSFNQKLEVAKQMCYSSTEAVEGFDSLIWLIENEPKFNDLNVHQQFEAVSVFARRRSEKATQLIIKFVNNENIEQEARYKFVLALDHYAQLRKDDMYKYTDYITDQIKSINEDTIFYQTTAATNIFNNDGFLIFYRVLAGQLLLQLGVSNDGKTEDKLLSFADDDELDYNRRADAADVVITLSSISDYKDKAAAILIKLGGSGLTVYDNKQNVHSRAIDESVEKGINFLFSNLRLCSNDDFENVKRNLEGHFNYAKHKNVTLTLKRIELDRAMYNNNQTLSSILVRLYKYIDTNENRDEMLNCLLQELDDAAHTCSSGIISRMINSISGFGDFAVEISIEDQVLGNISGRLNAKLQSVEDEELQAKIMEEMTLPSSLFDRRLNFLCFFRDHVGDILNDIRDEFKELCSSFDMDLYIRKALYFYEGEFY